MAHALIDLNVPSRLTDIHTLLCKAHLTHKGPLNIDGKYWLSSLEALEECGCDICKAMIGIITLEVDFTMAMQDDEPIK